MMKKITLMTLLSALSYNSVVHAGAMGDSNFCCAAFMSLEGGYTWNSLKNYNFTITGLDTSLVSTKKNQGYSGRLAAGMVSMMDDQFGFTGELGWGYYGRTNLNPIGTGLLLGVPASLSLNYTLSGFDALLGVTYVQPYFSLWLKAGALFENIQTKSSASFGPVFLPLFNNITLRNSTSVLPAVKVGGAYNFDSNWALTASALVAVGSSPKSSGTFDVNTLRSSSIINSRNPSLTAFLVGFQYTF